MNPDDTLLLANPYQFFWAYTLLMLGLGFWLRGIFHRARIKQLQARIDRQRDEILRTNPRRMFNLR